MFFFLNLSCSSPSSTPWQRNQALLYHDRNVGSGNLDHDFFSFWNEPFSTKFGAPSRESCNDGADVCVVKHGIKISREKCTWHTLLIIFPQNRSSINIEGEIKPESVLKGGVTSASSVRFKCNIAILLPAVRLLIRETQACFTKPNKNIFKKKQQLLGKKD